MFEVYSVREFSLTKKDIMNVETEQISEKPVQSLASRDIVKAEL